METAFPQLSAPFFMDNWKQPIPTDIQYDNRFTFLERALLREILTLCQRETTVAQFEQAGKHYAVELRRGQCVLKIAAIATNLGLDWKRVRRSIDFLSKWYSQMEIKGKPYGLLITVKNYDTLVEMESQLENQRRMKGESKENERRAKENVKNEKNEKNEKRNTLTISKDMVTDSEGKVLNSLIARFKPINPSYKQLFANRTQRAAMKRMLSEHGEETMVRLLEALPEVVVKPYAPRVTTPLQLESKFGELVVFMQQEKKKGGEVVYVDA